MIRAEWYYHFSDIKLILRSLVWWYLLNRNLDSFDTLLLIFLVVLGVDLVPYLIQTLGLIPKPFKTSSVLYGSRNLYYQAIIWYNFILWFTADLTTLTFWCIINQWLYESMKFCECQTEYRPWYLRQYHSALIMICLRLSSRCC